MAVVATSGVPFPRTRCLSEPTLICEKVLLIAVSSSRVIMFRWMSASRNRVLAGILLFPSLAVFLSAQDKVVWSAQEKPIADQIRGLRKLDDTVRARTTKELALQIRQLPVVPNKLRLAGGLAGLSTEGDFGSDTLQEVTTTLAKALQEQPPAGKPGEPNDLYMELASLVRYEHMKAESDNPQFAESMAKLEAADEARQKADFTLSDLQGKQWHLRDLRGKVVLVNFWATWCPPCRKEMPDLQALYDKYKDQGFVILAISDEEAAKVSPFISERKISYPVMLDPGRKVNDLFQVAGIPKSFVYDRDGKMVAQSIDMRTRNQFQEMLAAAGLQ
jgi:peroxiredoxin